MEDKTKYIVCWMNPTGEQTFYYDNYIDAHETYNDLVDRDVKNSHIYFSEVKHKTNII